MLPGGIERRRAREYEQTGGGPYRVSYILGEGRGQGFEVCELHLPKDWKNAQEEIWEFSTHDWKGFKDQLEVTSRALGVDMPRLYFDGKSGILTHVMGGQSTLYLDNQFEGINDGAYRFEKVNNIKDAILFMHAACMFLDQIADKSGWPRVAMLGKGKGYFPENLVVPKEAVESKEDVFWDIERFVNRAHNIAGRLGQNIKDIKFEEKGLLTVISTEPGDRCTYTLSGHFSQLVYSEHNVDNPWQAATLHAVAAEYINILLKRIEYNKELA